MDTVCDKGQGLLVVEYFPRIMRHHDARASMVDAKLRTYVHIHFGSRLLPRKVQRKQCAHAHSDEALSSRENSTEQADLPQDVQFL